MGKKSRRLREAEQPIGDPWKTNRNQRVANRVRQREMGHPFGVGAFSKTIKKRR